MFDELDEDEDTERDDKEIDDGLEEITVLDADADTITEPVWNRDVEVGEIDTTDNHPDDWHDDVVDESGDDFSECGTDDDTDGEVDDVALVDEFGKFFHDFRLFAMNLCGVFVCTLFSCLGSFCNFVSHNTFIIAYLA